MPFISRYIILIELVYTSLFLSLGYISNLPPAYLIVVHSCAHASSGTGRWMRGANVQHDVSTVERTPLPLSGVSRVSLSGASRQYPRPARADVPLWHPCARPADRRSVRWCGSRVPAPLSGATEARGPAGPGPRPSASPVAGSGALWVWPMPATADTRSEGDGRDCIVYSAVQLYIF